MSRVGPDWLKWSLLAASLAAVACVAADGSTITLKDGRQLVGRVGKTSGLADNPLNNNNGKTTEIVFVDDDLCRRFFHTFWIRSIDQVNTGEIPERINIRQHVASEGGRINRVGPVVRITPFDNFGRRVFTMMTEKGRLDVVQGITLITPVWTKVEALVTKQLTPVVWDMRIATSSIPRETLHEILVNNTNRKSLEQRLRIVRLLLQAERYQDAQKELEGVIADFPEEKILSREVQSLKQLQARGVVQEIEMRRKASQHRMAYTYLEGFPAKDVAGEILEQVREMLAEYQKIRDTFARVDSELTAHIKALPDGPQKEECQKLFEEMRREASVGTLDRLAAYLRLSDDPSMGPEQKLSLALSGWLMGTDYADTNLAVSLSLAKIRDIIHRYMNEPQALQRKQLQVELSQMEGSSPLLVARLIARMKPPLDTPAPSVATPGYYRLSVPIGLEREPDATYLVQLPPEYDPYVRYPTIVTLNGAGTTPENQLDWWAGARNDQGQRLGQATRLGHIVIAVDWTKEGQIEYGFTAREHAAVLASLRDACRRFSIDTDRVFLTGHSMGGDAAWDLGLAHPDLWAGVIPIVARSRKYCAHYWQNAKLVPFYVVQGEMDGDKVKENSRDLDRYMTRRYDATVVEYQGRGHEDFYEEIQHIFDWMGRREPRNFFPKEFTVSTMRAWDNFFWWLEVTSLPPRTIVEPEDWPPGRGVRPAELRAKVLPNGDIVVSSGGIQAVVWLAPDVVDPARGSIDVTVAGRRTSVKAEPDLEVLLEDVRTRGDRLHPFWAKVAM